MIELGRQGRGLHSLVVPCVHLCGSGRSLEDNERLPGEMDLSTSSSSLGARRFSFTGISTKNLRQVVTSMMMAVVFT